jgi:nucleotide-binding universal stress UspA family protein
VTETVGAPFRVLLATDDSDAARNAEAWVVRARWELPCTIDVLCVAGRGITRLGWGMQTYRTAVRDAVEQLRQSEVVAAERLANEVGLRLQAAGFMTRAWARQGDVVEEVLAAIELERPDLMVIGPRGRSGLAQMLLGSVSRRVIAETDRPVLVARTPPDDHERLPQDMLMVLDGRRAGEEALEWLAAAGWACGERITLLGLLGVAPGLELDEPDLVSQVTEAMRDDALCTLDLVSQRLTELGAEVTVEVEWGHPVEGTLRVAERLAPDLIIVARPAGRRSHDPFAEKVARYARTSVLVVPQP